MRCYEGGQTIEVPVTLASIPMFLREGAVVAMADNELHTHGRRPGEKTASGRCP